MFLVPVSVLLGGAGRLPHRFGWQFLRLVDWFGRLPRRWFVVVVGVALAVVGRGLAERLVAALGGLGIDKQKFLRQVAAESALDRRSWVRMVVVARAEVVVARVAPSVGQIGHHRELG
jgi:hypothetical protein